jgi:hypothetical protein
MSCGAEKRCAPIARRPMAVIQAMAWEIGLSVVLFREGSVSLIQLNLSNPSPPLGEKVARSAG